MVEQFFLKFNFRTLYSIELRPNTGAWQAMLLLVFWFILRLLVENFFWKFNFRTLCSIELRPVCINVG